MNRTARAPRRNAGIRIRSLCPSSRARARGHQEQSLAIATSMRKTAGGGAYTKTSSTVFERFTRASIGAGALAAGALVFGMMAEEPKQDARERDARGRPRNARPRDELGRPLPRGEAGMIPGEEPPPDPATALDRGIAEFNQGRYFQAHEIWEEGWHPAPEPERDFWQGLIQVAVGLTHRQRGNQHGAVKLLRRGAKRLRPYGEEHEGVPAAAISAYAERTAKTIEQHGVAAPIEVTAIART